MATPNNRALKIAAIASGALLAFVVLILYLGATGVVTPQMALLMLVALFGLYFGFGVLIAAYRLVSKLH